MRMVCCIKFGLIESFHKHRHSTLKLPQRLSQEFCSGSDRFHRAVKGEMRLSGREIRCVRGGRDVFSGLDFEVSSGEALSVVGANGAGKTSLLRMIAGLLPLAGGSIALDRGDSELTLPEQAHYLGHRDPLKPSLSVVENLAFWRDFIGGEDSDSKENVDERTRQSLAAVGLDHAGDLPS